VRQLSWEWRQPPVRSDGGLRRNAARIFGQAYEYAPRQMPQYHSSRDVYGSYSRLANNNLNADARRHHWAKQPAEKLHREHAEAGVGLGKRQPGRDDRDDLAGCYRTL
jgi:hypothetical protein